MKLPFTIKNKRKNTNLKFELKNYFIFTSEKVIFLFLTLINTAPFGTLITPGVVPIMLHTLLCLLVAHSWTTE